jgi:hypothetical protein
MTPLPRAFRGSHAAAIFAGVILAGYPAPAFSQFASCTGGPAGSQCLSSGAAAIGTPTATDDRGEIFTLLMRNTRFKADAGQYVGLEMETADSTSPLIGRMQVITDPTPANRHMLISAFESGGAYRDIVLAGHVGFGVSPITLLSNTSSVQNDGGRGVAGTGLTWVQTHNGDTGYTAGFVNPQSYGPGETAHGVFVKIADTSAQSNILSLLSGPDTSRFLVRGDGKIGVGTASPCASGAPSNCLLSVNGAVQAKEVVVNTGWSDYVFDADYRLAPLDEIADYVRTNHHLPGIPSAAEVAEKGVSVGDMQAKLLAKIEELTLQMIAAEKRIRELESREERAGNRSARSQSK